MPPQISYESYAAIGPKVVSGKGCQLGRQRNFPWTWPCITMLMLRSEYFGRTVLTLWGKMTHICVCNWTIIGSDNSLSPGRRQAVIWTIARMLLIRPLGTKLNWHSNRNSYPAVQENALGNVVRKMTANLFRPRCVNTMAGETSAHCVATIFWTPTPLQQ